VVLTRTHTGCRNVDLIASATRPGRFRVIEKWDDRQAVQRHLDDPQTAQLAREIVPLLAAPPELELYDSISAHDLH
jgi:quinol monooxygenase YgiN